MTAIDPTSIGAFGTGLATIAADGTVLDTWFPAPELGDAPAAGTRRLSGDEAGELAELTGPDAARGVEVVAVRTGIAKLSEPPADAHDVYLRLHLLSARLVRPHGVNLDGLFGLLANVVWTNFGPCPVADFERTRLRLRGRGAGDGLRRGQVPADGRLRAAFRGAHRRRRPGAAGCASGVRHDGDARGLRELQRRHAGRVDDRGPGVGRCGGR
ncbi:hypothetical protein [Nonomuraea salmonea]|uniref:hypothetical protein n=1 Tax=Nonomuraea salmonea TaxID=46181 RepID=UPI0031EE02D2